MFESLKVGMPWRKHTADSQSLLNMEFLLCWHCDQEVIKESSYIHRFHVAQLFPTRNCLGKVAFTFQHFSQKVLQMSQAVIFLTHSFVFPYAHQRVLWRGSSDWKPAAEDQAFSVPPLISHSSSLTFQPYLSPLTSPLPPPWMPWTSNIHPGIRKNFVVELRFSKT